MGAFKNYALENAFLGIRPPGHFLVLPPEFLLGLPPRDNWPTQFGCGGYLPATKVDDTIGMH